MTFALLDTSVASLFLPARKERPERASYANALANKTWTLSFQSVAELWKLAEKHGWLEPRRERLRGFIRRFVVAPFSEELCQIWARVVVAGESEGRPFETGDAWIAATAIQLGLPLYSLDGDFLDRSIGGFTVIRLEPE